MPKCKNDAERNYKGTEPSPKGLGYCAHAEKLGSKRQGLDGKKWVVKQTKNGVRRWVKEKINPPTVVKYEKKDGNYIYMITGLESDKDGYIYKNISFNEFEKKETKIPKGYKKKSMKKDHIKEFYLDPSRKLLTKNNDIVKNKPKYKGYKTYLIHDNGGRPFLVYVSKDKVDIYKYPGEKSKYYIREKDHGDEWTYVIKVASYKPIKTFVGNSPKTPMTKFSGGHGPRFDGNSILLQLNRDRYVFIGSAIYEFSVKGDTIKEYISPVGNSDVPYPVAIGEQNIYFMLDQAYVPIEKFPSLTRSIKNDAYSYFYGHCGDKRLSDYSKKMKNFKMIHKRIY